mgnify:FL=1
MPDFDDDIPRSSDELAQDRTDLAFERSRMAAERTTMGYLRTSISLIGFGFSIPTFFQFLKSLPEFADLSTTRPRVLGMSLLFLAVVMLITAIVQQTIYLRRLSKESGEPYRISIASMSSLFVLAIAFSSIFMIISRIGQS